MIPNTQRARLCACLFAVLISPLFTVLSLAQQAQTPHSSSFSLAQQSTDASGRTVILMQGTGDLPGVLTLVLSLNADGSIGGGEWALNVSYVAPLNPNAQYNPAAADPDETAGEQLIQKGVLSGTIASGSATVTNGMVTAVGPLQLLISQGTLQFAGVAQGNGTFAGTQINDRTNSTGNATLTF
jgi:hypothetical protein